MVVDAFAYMFVVGFGASMGVALTGFISFKLYGKLANKNDMKKNKRF